MTTEALEALDVINGGVVVQLNEVVVFDIRNFKNLPFMSAFNEFVHNLLFSSYIRLYLTSLGFFKYILNIFRCKKVL